MKNSKRSNYFKCDFCGCLEDKNCENICSGCGKLICLNCRTNITFTPFDLCESQDTPDTLCEKCEQNLKEFEGMASAIENETEKKLNQLLTQWREKCRHKKLDGENKVEKPINIYTVKASEVARKTYRIQANTEDEALQIAAKLWGKDKYEDAEKDPSEIRIKSKNSSFNESDLKYVDNK